MNKELSKEYKITRTFIDKDGTLCCDYKGEWGDIENE